MEMLSSFTHPHVLLKWDISSEMYKLLFSIEWKWMWPQLLNKIFKTIFSVNFSLFLKAIICFRRLKGLHTRYRYWSHTGSIVLIFKPQSKTVNLITKRSLREWTKWCRWVWSSVYEKKQNKLKEKLFIFVQLSIWSTYCADFIKATERQTFWWKIYNTKSYRLGWSHYPT